MKRLLWRLGLVQLVWTIDADGDRRLRVVRKDEQGLFVYAITRSRRVRLRAGGLTDQKTYVKRWMPYEGHAANERASAEDIAGLSWVASKDSIQ